MVQGGQAPANVCVAFAVSGGGGQQEAYGPPKHASVEGDMLHAMADGELEAHIAGNLEGYTEMELKLFPKPSAAPGINGGWGGHESILQCGAYVGWLD